MGYSGLEDCRGRTDAGNMNKVGSEKMSSKQNNNLQDNAEKYILESQNSTPFSNQPAANPPFCIQGNIYSRSSCS
jgi:hypothetical protein